MPNQILATALCLTLAVSGLAMPFARAADAMAVIDTDKDALIDINEAKSAASAKFVKLDTDKDDKLDHAEMKGHMTARVFRVADTDKDKILDQGEFMALVEHRFKAADTDNDGKIDAKELNTPSGRALLALLK